MNFVQVNFKQIIYHDCVKYKVFLIIDLSMFLNNINRPLMIGTHGICILIYQNKSVCSTSGILIHKNVAKIILESFGAHMSFFINKHIVQCGVRVFTAK